MIDININWVLEQGQNLEASDIHMLSGEVLTFRVNGFLKLTEKILKNTEIIHMALEILGHSKLEQLKEKKEYDMTYEDNLQNRYRMNFHYSKGNLGISIRVLQKNIPLMENLNFPKSVYNLLENKTGLILVSGSTGSGKTTSLAAMIEYLNSNRNLNIITIEDPVEYLFQSKKSIIRQREIGRDTNSFNDALKSALRQDPDVIMIGELRDLKSIQMAITIAETGHLVLGTLHTIGAVESIDRIVDVFPKETQNQIRLQLSNILRGILNQQLVPKTDKSLTAAYELLINNQAVGNYILSGKTNQIHSIMESSGKLGMITMKKSLETLYNTNIISKENFDRLIQSVK